MQRSGRTEDGIRLVELDCDGDTAVHGLVEVKRAIRRQDHKTVMTLKLCEIQGQYG